MDEVVEAEIHNTLKSGSNILEVEWHDLIHKHTRGVCEGILVLVFFPDMNLVISKKAVHEGKDLMSSAFIDNLIDEGCWKVVFETRPIQITKFCANLDGTMFFIHRNRI